MQWKISPGIPVIEGTVRSLVRSAPRGYAPDWVRFDRQGKVIPEKGADYTLGSYNAIRTYMWAAMMSPADPVHDILVEHFEPFAKLTRDTNMPPEKINIITGERHGYGSPGFAACVLELLGKGPTQDYLRTVIENDPIIGENYYRNTLMLYAIGFDRGLYRFDRNGYLQLSPKAQLTQVPPKAMVPVDKSADKEDHQEEAEEAPEQVKTDAATPATNNVTPAPAVSASKATQPTARLPPLRRLSSKLSSPRLQPITAHRHQLKHQPPLLYQLLPLRRHPQVVLQQRLREPTSEIRRKLYRTHGRRPRVMERLLHLQVFPDPARLPATRTFCQHRAFLLPVVACQLQRHARLKAADRVGLRHCTALVGKLASRPAEHYG